MGTLVGDEVIPDRRYTADEKRQKLDELSKEQNDLYKQAYDEINAKKPGVEFQWKTILKNNRADKARMKGIENDDDDSKQETFSISVHLQEQNKLLKTARKRLKVAGDNEDVKQKIKQWAIDEMERINSGQ